MSLPPAVDEDFQRQLAELAIDPGRVALVPQPPLGWGADLSCVTDCDSQFSELTIADGALIVAQSVTRRLITPRGSLLDDADFGFDLRGYCNRGVTQQDLRTLQTRVTAEVLKDERVASAVIDVTISNNGGGITVRAQITPADPALQPFTTIIAVTDKDALIDVIT